ncbi:MAG TPA: chemotaxis protein CheW, partial [Longimicrobium sp.]|nr:chemotaxis protein CheW [Longimicrobium sp.]
MEILVFEVEGERYALDTGTVREVVRAVAVSRLPGAPPIVLGVIDVRGILVPVLDLRARFGLPPRAVDPAEHFVIAEAGERAVALRVDRTVGIAEVDDASVAAPREPGADAGYAAAA